VVFILIYCAFLVIVTLIARDIFGTNVEAAAWVQGVGSVGAIGATALFAFSQSMRDKEQRQVDRTIAICGRYHFDPTINSAYRTLYDQIKRGYLPDRVDALTFLNYLDLVAYGVNHGLYEYGFVVNNIAIADYTDELFHPALTKYWGISKDEFRELFVLRQRIGGAAKAARYDMSSLRERLQSSSLAQAVTSMASP
jgi:hypothetical protein